MRECPYGNSKLQNKDHPSVYTQCLKLRPFHQRTPIQNAPINSVSHNAAATAGFDCISDAHYSI